MPPDDKTGIPTTPEQADQLFALQHLNSDDTTVEILGKVGANIANFMMVIAGIVVVAAVIYAGWQMISAGGEESKIETAKKQLINALTATAIIFLVLLVARAILDIITT